MQKDRLRYLLEQQLAEKASPEEQQEITALLKADTHPDLFKEVMAEMMQLQAPALPDNQASWQGMVQDIVGVDKSAQKIATISKRSTFRLYRWAAAAAVLLIVGAAAYFISTRSSAPSPTGPGNAIPALAASPSGRNQLTLPDGSQVMLDEQKNGVIARLGNITVTKQDKQIIYTCTGPAESSGYHTLYTARGSNYEIIMADGSLVSLNASSSLRFSDGFSAARRFVELAGEAWFDVHHADQLPFSIQSGRITTTVLGTAFDIKAYPDQQTMTVAVQRGKVKVETGNKTLATLVKGQQVKITADSAIPVQRIDTSLVGAWKQGNLNYEDEPLYNIVADLQRVFSDSISIQNAAVKDLRITARYQQKDGLRQILTMICNLSDSRLVKKNGIFIIE